jgi:medium-chain acyl-[acyl-carrier-protein] hydrolase
LSDGHPTFRAPAATCLKQNPGARLRLFCFPFAGGGARAFGAWTADLPPDLQRDVELWAVNLPGREATLADARFTDLVPLVEALRPRIVPVLDAPFAFFGHSMGALIGFELARSLRAEGLEGPVHLVVSAFRAPHLPNRHEPVQDLPDADLVRRLRKLGGTPPEVLGEPELLDLVLPLLRADLRLCETYVYRNGEPLDCSLTAFCGASDPEVNRDELNGWRSHVRGPFELHVFPGGHFFLQTGQALVLRILARDLRAVMRRLDA